MRSVKDQELYESPGKSRELGDRVTVEKSSRERQRDAIPSESGDEKATRKNGETAQGVS